MMSIKHRFIKGALIGMLGISTAWSNGPASTDHVKSAIDSVRNELNSAVTQLMTNINVLSATDSQLLSLINELTTRLDTLRNSTHESGKNFDNKIDKVQNQVSELPIITYKIGDIVHGGMVFFVDASRQHGLMMSLTDLAPEGIEWRNGEGGDRRVNAKAQGLGAGETNTRLIVAEQTVDDQEGQFAALVAANYQVTEAGTYCESALHVTSPCFGGWYLPSVYELMLLHTNIKQSGLSDLPGEAYWSSSEASITEAWVVDFENGEGRVRDKSTPARIRAIHSF